MDKRNGEKLKKVIGAIEAWETTDEKIIRKIEQLLGCFENWEKRYRKRKKNILTVNLFEISFFERIKKDLEEIKKDLEKKFNNNIFN